MNLKKNRANYTPLTPIDFLKRTASIFPNYISLISKYRCVAKMRCLEQYLTEILTVQLP